MKLRCKRHNEAIYVNCGLFGMQRKPVKRRIKGITRGRLYEGHPLNVRQWMSDYLIMNDDGQFEYYDAALFEVVDEDQR